MSIWLWISGIVILIFAVIVIISFLIPDETLERTAIGKGLKIAKNCCKKAFQRKKFKEYDF